MSTSTSTHLTVLAATSGILLITTILSWRKQAKLEKDCQDLRSALSKKTSDRASSTPSDRAKKSTEEPETTATTTNHNGKSRVTLEDQGILQDGLNVKPIGILRSIYRLCVGTPRQGLLAPKARGCIELLRLGDSSPSSSVSGLQEFSHIWVLFVFHLNTQAKNASRIKSKIAPPALGGQKVGIFATRTPHRFNPIGITLCKLDRVEINKKQDAVRLHVSGLDLVDGTPILDVKPFVPVYDSVPDGDYRLPNWVSGGLSMKRPVTITKTAREQLFAILDKNPKSLEFYGPNNGERSVEETLESALECIQQVLAMDVRSSYQTKKSRSGKFQAQRSGRVEGVQSNDPTTETLCTQQLDNLLITYKVEEASTLQRTPSENSGAEDMISVTTIQLLKT